MKLVTLIEHPKLDKKAQSDFCTNVKFFLGTFDRRLSVGMVPNSDALTALLQIPQCIKKDGSKMEVRLLRDCDLNSVDNVVGFELLDSSLGDASISVYTGIILPIGANYYLGSLFDQ